MEYVLFKKLNKDVSAMIGTLSKDEVRFLVDNYYIIQDDRKRCFSQERSLEEANESHEIVSHFAATHRALETNLKTILDKYTDAIPIGQWAKSIVGIGPVITAGLYAHIDIAKAPTAGHIWSFAGFNPNAKWEKGQKRPWNADLKTLGFKIGDCFIKFSNHKADFYGRYYREYKEYITQKNERGEYRDQCLVGFTTNQGVWIDAYLSRIKNKTTDAYKYYSEGKLPPGHLHSRARRHVVKLFLSHWHEVAYWLEYKQLAPQPYAIAHLGHSHFIEVPNVELVPGMLEARRKQGPVQYKPVFDLPDAHVEEEEELESLNFQSEEVPSQTEPEEDLDID